MIGPSERVRLDNIQKLISKATHFTGSRRSTPGAGIGWKFAGVDNDKTVAEGIGRTVRGWRGLHGGGSIVRGRSE